MKKLNIFQIVILGIIPQALIIFVVLVVNPARIISTIPFINNFIIGFLVVIWHLSWLMIEAKRINDNYLNFQGVIIYQFKSQTVPLSKLLLIPGLLILIFIVVGVSGPIMKMLQGQIIPYIPEWFYSYGNFNSFDPNYKIFALTSYLFLATIGVYIQELYYRGYLLPRMENMGRWSTFVNSLIFSISHLNTPWQWIPLAVAFWPTIYFVKKDKSLIYSVAVHFLLNLATMPVALGLVPVP